MFEMKDCLEFLKDIDSNSIDMVLVDPPYSIGFDGGKGWDSKWKHKEEYLAWCERWSNECVRVLKPERMMIVWGTLKESTSLKYKLMMDEHSNLFAQNEIIWSYNWGGRIKHNFARKHELAWCWSKGEQFLFNDDDVRVERKTKKNVRTGKAFEKGTIPTCVWEKNNHTMSKDYVDWHPTVKNLFVLERMIKAYTNPGDTVLDCFMGSGSTAIAAIRNDRKFVGCELDKEYFEKANERIQAELNLRGKNE